MLVATCVLAGCGASPAAAPPVLVVPVADSTTHGATAGAAPEPAVDPPPRTGMARRFLRLPAGNASAAPVPVAMDVPAAWGIRVRDAGGRALRPCEVSPSSPSELFVQARPACDSTGCADHEKIEGDLVRAKLITPASVETRGTESRGAAKIARLSGHIGARSFSAFRSVQVDAQSLVPVACEAFLFEDEVRWMPAYEAACASLRIGPADFQAGAEEIAAAPDGRARSPVEEAAAQAAIGYVTALGARDTKAATQHLLTAAECVASGGASDGCESGAAERAADLRFGFERIPPDMPVGAADVRFPAALPGLAIATVKRRGDPCGPGYEVTLAPGDHRFAVAAAEPIPDPHLAQ